jgi:hypothetical protein
MAIDPEILRHKEWLGFLQPVGLVVSPPALVKAQAIVNRNVVDLQQALLSIISRDLQLVDDDRAWIFDFPAFTVNVLGGSRAIWSVAMPSKTWKWCCPITAKPLHQPMRYRLLRRSLSKLQ